MAQLKNRNGTYTNSTGTCTYNPGTGIATSYNWWEFFKPIEGFRVWNKSYYSATTSQHQSKVMQLVNKIDISLDVPEGLQTINKAEELLPYVAEEVAELRKKIPTGRGQANQDRIARYDELLQFSEKVYALIMPEVSNG